MFVFVVLNHFGDQTRNVDVVRVLTVVFVDRLELRRWRIPENVHHVVGRARFPYRTEKTVFVVGIFVVVGQSLLIGEVSARGRIRVASFLVENALILPELVARFDRLDETSKTEEFRFVFRFFLMKISSIRTTK